MVLHQRNRPPQSIRPHWHQWMESTRIALRAHHLALRRSENVCEGYRTFGTLDITFVCCLACSAAFACGLPPSSYCTTSISSRTRIASVPWCTRPRAAVEESAAAVKSAPKLQNGLTFPSSPAKSVALRRTPSVTIRRSSLIRSACVLTKHMHQTGWGPGEALPGLQSVVGSR